MAESNGSLNTDVLEFDKTLTAEEIAAPTYFDWDDATLGRYIKSQQKYLVGWRKDGWDKVGNMAACMVLIINARSANAEEVITKLSDVTFGGMEPEIWEITVKKQKSKRHKAA